MLNILLQATVAVAAKAAPEEGLSVFSLVVKGGPIMIPILLLSLISVFLFVERLLFINKASKIDKNLVNNVKDMLIREDIKGALTYCDRIASPFAKLVHKGLSRLGSPIRDIESAIENTARVEVYKMEKNINLLAAVAALAPMFGFLGTVVGMIRAFYDISMSDNISIGIIASGIYVKMVTSASGLIVGVFAYIFYTYLNTKIERTVNKMEVTAIDFLDILYKPVS
ncbi:MAG: MotA/TolQ/ExbB proton channel family protein [Bacteroidia bacterium]